MKRALLLTFGLCLAFFYSLYAGNEDEPLEVVRLSKPIVFDGMPDEDAWEEIAPISLITTLPIFGKKPSERCEVRLSFDDEYLYLAGRLYDSEPEKIAATSKKRDAMVMNTDWFGMVIDSYNDKENGLGFFTNPNGLRFDASVANDALSQEPINISWNTFWDAQTVINEQGWFVEMRIPFSSLQFQVEDEDVVMGIIIMRWIARKNESAVFPSISPDYGEMGTWRPSLAREIRLRKVQRRRPFYVAPYLLGGFHQLHELNTQETRYLNEQQPKIEAGLDVKYGLTNNLTLDLTVNTDFAQVEADDQQVNLTRSSLFFPEKRLFFQERAGIFNFSFGSRDQLFYSRRIGINEDGQPVRIYGGARLVGRVSDWDVGLISMQTAAQDAVSSENFTVARLRRQVFNQYSDAGMILTNRFDQDGNYNTTYGLDATIRLFEDDQLSIRWAQTFQDSMGNNLFSTKSALPWISLSRRRARGFAYGVSISRAGAEFDPGIGFIGRENYTRQGMRMSYGWLPGENSRIQQHGPTYRGVTYWTNEDGGSLQSYSGTPGWQVVTKTGFQAEVGWGINQEHVDETITFADDAVEIEPGDYFFHGPEIMFTTPQALPYYLMTQFSAGGFYDGNRFSLMLAPNYSVSSSLELSATYEYNRLDFPDRATTVNLHIARVKALYMLDTRFSISSFVQYNSTAGNFLGNIRFRYNPREGNDLYLVYNDDLNTNRGKEWPTLPMSNQRSLLVKYTYTFVL